MQKKLRFALLALTCLAMLNIQALDLEKRLEPPPPESEQLIATDTVAAWEQVPGYPKVSLTLQDGVLRLDWNGASDYNGPRPLFGRIQSKELIPLVPGHANKIRITIDVATDKLSDDSMLQPMLRFYNAKDEFLFERDFYSPDYQTYFQQPCSLERPRRLDLTLEVPRDAAKMQLAFECRGNALTASVFRIGISPARYRMKWNVEEHWKRQIKKPDIQYAEDDGLQPVEDVPVMTDAEVKEMLEKAPVLVAKAEKMPERVKFSVNGEEEPFTIFWPPYERMGAYYQTYRKQGFKLMMIPVVLGPRADSHGWPFNIWLDEDKYDFEPLAEGIRWVLQRVPDAHIVLNIRVTLPTAWAEKHPDAIFTNAKGERAVSEWSRINRFGGEPPQGEREFYEASNVSQEFRDGGSRALYAIGKWLNQAPEGKVVVGAYIIGGADCQWLHSFEPEFADYSSGALKAFRSFLQQKYNFDAAALSKAWGFPVDFSNAQIPAWADRRRQFGPDPNLPRSPLMDYNCQKQQAADYNQFMSVANTKRQIAFSHALKQGCDGRLVVGTYWPTLPANYPLSHGDFIEMLNSPDVDFISRGGLLGGVFHGKLCVGEFDLRNTQSGLDAWVDYDHPMHAKSNGEFRRDVLRRFTAELSAGAGYHLWDMGGGWHWHPTTQEIFKEAQALTKFVKDGPLVGENYIGVFVDEDAADQLAGLGNSYNCASFANLNMKMGWEWAASWGQVGLPVRFYLQKDALNSDLVLPRVAVFLNPLTMTLEQGEAIRKRFENQGRCVVYMGEPGLAAPGTTENPSIITGFTLLPDVPGTSNKVVRICAEDPLFKGMVPNAQIGLYSEWDNLAWNTCPVAAPTSSGKVIGKYAGTDFPAMLVDRNDQRTKIWIGLPGALNATLLRNMAREAGLEPMLDNNSTLYYGNGLLAITGTPAGGIQKVRIPDNAKIACCLTKHPYTIEGGYLVFTLKISEVYGDVAVFSVEPK